MALGVASFAGAAGGVSGAGLGGISGGAMAMDAANAAENVRAQVWTDMYCSPRPEAHVELSFPQTL